MRDGRKIVLGLKALTALRKRLEAKYFEGAIPVRGSASTPPPTAPQADAPGAEMVRTATAPSRGSRTPSAP